MIKGIIDSYELWQSRPENLNENMEDEIEAAENRGWNQCNRSWIKTIEEQPRVGEWTPCSERLPVPNEYDETGKFFKAYLVQDKRETMYTALWNGENWLLWTRNIRIENVIAWMPLPLAYKEGESS